MLIAVLFLFQYCNRKDKPDGADSPSQGTIHISVDESFKPVIDEEIKMYEATYPGTEIIAHYKPEADCLRDFFNDSTTRLVIITRGLTAPEEKYFTDSLGYMPGWNKIASDAITLIVNAASTDTLFTIDRLQKQLTGKINREQRIVFDGLNATSTVRYIRDSLLRSQKFDSSVVKAARSSREVIDYVAKNENAIGMVGISWIGNPEDTAQLNLLKNVKIAYVQCMACSDSPYVKPVQESIRSRRYPLVRGLYYIIKENYTGLGSGFVSFLKNERGQLIFKRAYLGTIMEFGVRNVKINQTLDQK
jgi:phosphate transport system substrate-binding protein